HPKNHTADRPKAGNCCPAPLEFGTERFEKDPKSIKHSRGAKNVGQKGDSNDLPSPFPFVAWALDVERFGLPCCDCANSICHNTPTSFSDSERSAPGMTDSTNLHYITI